MGTVGHRTDAGPAYLTAIANAGQVLPLDDFAEKYKWRERFLPRSNTSVYGGKPYARRD
jgi:raffinose/stachyose/melibiose transport system substrate-binding protein